MAVDIVVPSVGESISEGVLARWLKQDGDAVTEGEPVFELETEKATGEVPAPATGVLHTGTSEGQLVKVGAVVGSVAERAAAPEKKEKPKASGGRKSPGDAPADSKEPPKKSQEPSPALSPAARRLAEEESVDPAKVKGTGRDGRIIKEDIQAQVAAPAKPPAAPAVEKGRETRQRMSSIRQRIADRLVQSQQTTATLTTFNEADMTAVIALRDRHKERFQEKHGVKLGFMGFFVKAAVEALRSFPIVNSRIDGADIVTCHYYDIGVAVSTERGLFVPVVRDPDKLSLAHIEKRLGALAVKARDGKIAVEDLQGGTFTITNGGVFGSLLSTPLLNPPQSAILGMHTIQKRPVAVDDAVVVRPMMYLALSYDHRLIDGREAVQFLIRVKECIEAPERLLLEV